MIHWDFDLQYEEIMRMVGHVSASYGCHMLPMKVDEWRSITFHGELLEKHGICMHL